MNSLGVAGNEFKAAGFPIGLGCFDAVLARGDEIPPDVARPIHGGAADHDDMRVTRRRHVDAVTGFEHQEPFRAVTVAGNLDLAGDDINGALLMIGGERQDRAGFEMSVGEHGVPACRDGRAQPVHRSGDDAQHEAVLAQFGNVGCRGMGESGRGLFVLHRQRDP